MPIYNGGGGVAGITVENDPSALKLANNLSDLPNTGTARTNLNVYSKTQVDQAIAAVPAGPQGPAGPTGAAGATGEAGAAGAVGNTGAQGVAGQAGVNGSMLFNYLGAYNNGVTYTVNDAVTFQGSTYVMTTSVGGAGYDPVGYPSYWTLVVSKGDTGAAGTNGTNGENGAVTSAQVIADLLSNTTVGSSVVVYDSMGLKALTTANYQSQAPVDYSGPYATQNGSWVQLPITSVSSSSNGSGYSNGQFDTTHYPYELTLVVGGVSYKVPART
jgi:hypothetical protein